MARSRRSAKSPRRCRRSIAKELKARKDWRLIGKGVPRRDTPSKVNGTAHIRHRRQLPGMVYATTLHSPVHNTAPESWNDAEIKAMPGVVATVKLPNGVAVVADRFERALAARDALKVSGQKGKADGFNSVQALRRTTSRSITIRTRRSRRVRSKGDAAAAFASAAKTYKAEFRSDFGYHAQMEPLNAVARFNDAGDKVEIWEGTPGARRCRARRWPRRSASRKSRSTHHQCYMGGGFGRRTVGD